MTGAAVLGATLLGGAVSTGIGLAAYAAWRRLRRHRLRSVRVAARNVRTARAELHLLKSQLHPHFLFNALNAVAALVRTDPGRAERMIARLSELLRAALDHASAQEVTLAEELRFLECYLEIERTRLGERLCVVVEVEEDARQALVPHLLLQPLVENAVRHGIAPRAAGGRVRVTAVRLDHVLRLEVRDDGPGLAGTGTSAGGLGLSNTRARLCQLYGRDFRLRAGDGPTGGFQVALEIPFRLSMEPRQEVA